MEPTASPSPVKPRHLRLKTARAFSLTVPRIAHGYSSHLFLTLNPTGAFEIGEARHKASPVLLDRGCLSAHSRIAYVKRKSSHP